jgi:hypothetical protein
MAPGGFAQSPSAGNQEHGAHHPPAAGDVPAAVPVQPKGTPGGAAQSGGQSGQGSQGGMMGQGMMGQGGTMCMRDMMSMMRNMMTMMSAQSGMTASNVESRIASLKTHLRSPTMPAMESFRRCH